MTEENTGKMMWEHSLPEIEDRARAIGHRYLQEDPDGVLRMFSPSLSDGSLTMPYLALKAAETAGPETILKDFGDNRGDLLIPWLQRSGDEAFAKIAVHDLIHSYYGIQKGVVPVVYQAVKDKFVRGDCLAIRGQNRAVRDNLPRLWSVRRLPMRF